METYPWPDADPERSLEKAKKHPDKLVAKVEPNLPVEQSQKQRAEHGAGSDQAQLEHEKHIDLLFRSAGIEVRGTTLQKLFESHRISQQALARLVTAYERGADIAPLVDKELLEHEKDHERDPMLRGQGATGNEEPAAVLRRILNQSGSPNADNQSPVKRLEPVSGAAQRPTVRPRLPRPAPAYSRSEVALGAVILVLLVIALVLLATR